MTVAVEKNYPSKVPDLPEEVIDQLKASRGTPELHALAAALRKAGWSLAAVSRPLGVTRESVRLWANAGDAAGTDLPLVPQAIESEAAAIATKRRRKETAHREETQRRERDALALYLPRLKELQADARRLHGPAASSPYYADVSAEYTKLLARAIDEGAPVVRLAEELGIKEVTIHARLRRWGYRQPAPSEHRVSIGLHR